MKPLFTILLLTIFIFATAQQPYKFTWKENLIPAACIFVAGISEGVMDHLAFHNTSNHPFWGQNSWTNKYRNHDPEQGETFRGKYLVFTTDGFHLMKMSRNLFTMGAIVTKVSLTNKKKWYYYVLEGLAYWGVNRLGFVITYQSLK